MKKFIAAIVFAAACLPAVAHASWQDDVIAAIDSGKVSEIDVIAAKNPGIQGELAMLLLQQAKAKMTTNLDLATKIFTSSTPFIAQIPQSKLELASSLIKDVVAFAGQNTNHGSCGDSGAIFGAALKMSNIPVIVKSQPNLHNTTVVAANNAMRVDPLCNSEALNDVLLAQQPPTPPTNGPRGPEVPSAE